MTPGLLEQRLQNLVFEFPDPRSVTTRVLSQGRRQRGGRFRRPVALGVTTVALVIAVLYFVPAADAVLADAPVAGDVLRDAGLTGAGDRITAVGAVAESSGYRLKLVGAYADSSRTVLLLHAEPAILPLGLSTQLTDQFGRTYGTRNGLSSSLTGDLVAQFDALAWPDSITGARITLHVTSIQPACSGATYCQEAQPPAATSVPGTWTLPATIGVDEGTVLALPAPAHLGHSTYRFTSVRITPATIAVDIELTGMSLEDLERTVPSPEKPTPYSVIELIDPTGQAAGGSGSANEDIWGVHLHFLWNRETPGDYRLHIAYLGAGDYESVLHVP